MLSGCDSALRGLLCKAVCNTVIITGLGSRDDIGIATGRSLWDLLSKVSG